MEEEIIFKIELNRPEAEADLRAITTATVSLKEENKLLQESIKNLQKAEGDNTKQIVEATAQIELNKNKIKELNQQQGSLIKTLDAEKGSINQLKAANIALLKERDNISKSTAEGKARIEALNKQYDENTKKINENISDTERQKQGYNTLVDILDKINPGTKELVTNVGTVSKGFTQSIGAINQYGFSLKALGSIPVLQLFTALTASITTITSLYKSSLPTVEDYRKENEELTKAYDKQQQSLALLEASTKRQVDLLRAEGKEKEANKVASQAAADRLIEEQLRVNQLSQEYEKLQAQLAATPAEYDKLTGSQQINKAEQDVLKEAIKQVGTELTTQKEIVATVLNEYNILQEQSSRLERQEVAEAKAAKERAEDEKRRLADLYESRQKLIDQRRRETLERAKALKGTGGKSTEDLILEAYENLEDGKSEADKKRQDNIDDVTERFLDGVKKREEREKRASDAKRKLNKIDVASQEERDQQLRNLDNIAFGLFKNKNAAMKLIASKQALIDAVESASAANKGMNKAFPGPVGIALGIAAAIGQILLGGLKVAAINEVQFARGGFLAPKRYHSGGMIYGPSHSDGGVKFSIGGRLGFEAEGGEAIINKRSVAMYRPLLSKINQAGGGVKFAQGAELSSSTINRISRESEASAFQSSLFNQVARTQTVLILEEFEAKKRQVDRDALRSVIVK